MRATFLALLLAAPIGACATDELPLAGDPRARDTGVFPSFAATPAAAAPQLPQARVDRDLRRLEGAGAEARARPEPVMVDERIGRLAAAGGAARANAPMPEDVRDELERIGRTHAAETLAEIEDR